MSPFVLDLDISSDQYFKFLCLVWFVLWSLMPLSTIFQLYHGGKLLKIISVEETGAPKENHRPVFK